jgi:hypothetical protein
MSPSRFSRASRGLRQECPMSPFLFLIVVEALSKMIKEAREAGRLKGVNVSERETISHPLFVDDILCCTQGSIRDISELKRILDLFSVATGMKFNFEKSCLILHNCSETDSIQIELLLLAPKHSLKEGFKYLGFYIKLDNYTIFYWGWLVKKIESRVSIWVNRLLSSVGRLVLLKSVLESISGILGIDHGNSKRNPQ